MLNQFEHRKTEKPLDQGLDGAYLIAEVDDLPIAHDQLPLLIIEGNRPITTAIAIDLFALILDDGSVTEKLLGSLFIIPNKDQLLNCVVCHINENHLCQ